MKDVYSSCKPTRDIMALITYLERGTGLSRAEIYHSAVDYVLNNQDRIDFNGLLTQPTGSYEGVVPVSLKIKILTPEHETELNQLLKEKYNLTRLREVFKLRILFLAYADHLDEGTPADPINGVHILRAEAMAFILRANKSQLEEVLSLDN